MVAHFKENMFCPTCKTIMENPTDPLKCVKNDPQKQAIVVKLLSAENVNVLGEKENVPYKHQTEVILENFDPTPIPGLKRKIIIKCDSDTTVEHLQEFVKISNEVNYQQVTTNLRNCVRIFF